MSSHTFQTRYGATTASATVTARPPATVKQFVLNAARRDTRIRSVQTPHTAPTAPAITAPTLRTVPNGQNKRKSRKSNLIRIYPSVMPKNRGATHPNQHYPGSGSPSYAKVMASANKQASTSHIPPPKHVQSIETQTDLTWPTNSEKPFHCKATATVQTDPSEHSALKQASGSLTSLSPTIPAPIAATVAGGGLPPQVGAKPTSPPAIASHLKKSSPVAPGDKSKPGPAVV